MALRIFLPFKLTPQVGFHIVALDRDFAGILAVDFDAALVSRRGNRRNKIANFRRMIRIADIDGANPGIKPGHKSEFSEENRRHAFIGRV